MSKLVPVLALTTAVLGATTAYLAYELQQTRAELNAQAITQGIQVAGDPELLGLPPNHAEVKANGATTAPGIARPPGGVPAAVGGKSAASAAADAPTDAQRAMMLSYARQWLAQYDDPAQRASLTRQAHTGLAAQYARLKEQLKLSDATFDQMIGLLADETLEAQEHYLRCLTIPTCDPAKFAQPTDHSQEYLALLGASGVEDFNKYRAGINERQMVTQFRGRLTDSNVLRDSDAERLVSAMSEETQKFRSDSEAQGASVKGWGNGTAMVWYSGDGGTDQALASAAQYSQRMRSRAAAMLTGEQLRVFNQLQDELLEALASYLRSNNGK